MSHSSKQVATLSRRSLDRRDFLAISGAAAAAATTLPGDRAAAAPLASTQNDRRAQAADEVVVGFAAEPAMLDSHMAGETPSHNVNRNICEPLLFRDENLELAPGLATEWSVIDDTTYEFKLREGVTFHNGEPFNAEVVKWNFERILDPDQNARGRSAISLVTSVEVIDEYTVHVKTSDPFPVLFARNTYSGTGSVVMLPPQYVEENGDEHVARNPVGTGPFRFVEWVAGDRITLEANEDYWGDPPSVARATFRFIPESSTRIAALLSGEVDIIEGVSPDQVERIENSGVATISESSDGMVVSYYQFNLTVDSPFHDVNVRRAVNHAIDREAIIDAILGGHARARPIPLDPNDFGVHPDLPFYEFDPEKARQLLADAGYEDGFEFTMHTSDGRYLQDMAIAETIASDLEKVGITVTVQPEEWGIYIGMLQEKTAGPMYIIGWGSGMFDADVLVDEFHSDSAYGSLFNEEVDELLTAARTTLDEEERKELFYQAQEILVDQAAFAMAYQGNAIFGISNRTDWQPSIGELIYLQNASVSGEDGY